MTSGEGDGIRTYERYCPHPWHGLSPGEDAPEVVRAFVEITRFDAIKYEIEPVSGYLKVDRPQYNSCLPPMVYGFVPRTLSGAEVAGVTGGGSEGDGDALDVCVLSEHQIDRSRVLLDARVIGALLTLDGGKADPKLIAVLERDLLWGDVTDLDQVHDGTLHRMKHYFRNYKGETGGGNPVEILGWADRSRALELVWASMNDYTCYLRDEVGEMNT